MNCRIAINLLFIAWMNGEGLKGPGQLRGKFPGAIRWNPLVTD